jgi:hypothetical protein
MVGCLVLLRIIREPICKKAFREMCEQCINILGDGVVERDNNRGGGRCGGDSDSRSELSSERASMVKSSVSPRGG